MKYKLINIFRWVIGLCWFVIALVIGALLLDKLVNTNSDLANTIFPILILVWLGSIFIGRSLLARIFNKLVGVTEQGSNIYYEEIVNRNLNIIQPAGAIASAAFVVGALYIDNEIEPYTYIFTEERLMDTYTAYNSDTIGSENTNS